MRKTILRSFATLLLVIVFTVSLLSAGAQQGGTTTYVYDDNGRLHAVIAPNGEAVIYEYDAAGNITAIRRMATDSLSILSFSPHEGLPGDQVVFTGTGFGGGVTNVSFNGASATIVSVTASRVVATVPQAATMLPTVVMMRRSRRKNRRNVRREKNKKRQFPCLTRALMQRDKPPMIGRFKEALTSRTQKVAGSET